MRVGIIADDFTGAADSSAQFLDAGFTVHIVLAGLTRRDFALIRDQTDVVVFDTESRDIAPMDAYAAVRRALSPLSDDFDALTLYKKVDSTMRGNIGAELKAAIDTYTPAFTIFAPAFIEAGRTTEHGFQLLDGTRLELTELAHVPNSAVTTSDIPAILNRDVALECFPIGTSVLDGGTQAVIEKLDAELRKGRRLFVCDATTKAHLAAIASAGAVFRRVLFAGSAGLAQALAPSFGLRTRTPFRISARRLLVLAGSISAVTRGQSERLLANRPVRLVRIDPALAVRDPERAASLVIDAIRDNGEDHAVLVSAAPTQEDVDLSRATAASLGLGFSEAGRRMAQVMALVACGCARDFDAFVMTGGDTAIHACQSMNTPVIRVLGELQRGVPVCRIAGGPFSGSTLITKAGAFGDPDVFVQAYDTLFEGGLPREN